MCKTVIMNTLSFRFGSVLHSHLVLFLVVDKGRFVSRTKLFAPIVKVLFADIFIGHSVLLLVKLKEFVTIAVFQIYFTFVCN